MFLNKKYFVFENICAPGPMGTTPLRIPPLFFFPLLLPSLFLSSPPLKRKDPLNPARRLGEPVPALPSPFFPSPPLPLRSRTPYIQLGGLGALWAPQRCLGRSPSWNRICCILALKYVIWWHSRPLMMKHCQNFKHGFLISKHVRTCRHEIIARVILTQSLWELTRFTRSTQ